MSAPAPTPARWRWRARVPWGPSGSPRAWSFSRRAHASPDPHRDAARFRSGASAPKERPMYPLRQPCVSGDPSVARPACRWQWALELPEASQKGRSVVFANRSYAVLCVLVTALMALASFDRPKPARAATGDAIGMVANYDLKHLGV